VRLFLVDGLLSLPILEFNCSFFFWNFLGLLLLKVDGDDIKMKKRRRR